MLKKKKSQLDHMFSPNVTKEERLPDTVKVPRVLLWYLGRKG